MKTTLLTERDLMNMDGQKVWVDCVGEGWDEDSKKAYSRVCIVNSSNQCLKLNFINSNDHHNFYCTENDDKYKINVYEWIDDNEILTGDEIENLPHGTRINFVDNYFSGVKKGIINQQKQMIGGYNGDINNCIYYFFNLKEKKIRAWIIEETKQEISSESIKETSEQKQYNLVEMIQEMKDTNCHFKSLNTNEEFCLIKGNLKRKFIYEYVGIANYHQEFLLQKFIKIENKPVDFMTAIKSEKKIRVEHKYIDKWNILDKKDDSYMNTILNDIKENKFMLPNLLLTGLGWISNKNTFKDIILNGKWYIQE